MTSAQTSKTPNTDLLDADAGLGFAAGTNPKSNERQKLIELIKKELDRQGDEDRYGTPYVSDVFGDKEFTIDGDIDLTKLADVILEGFAHG